MGVRSARPSSARPRRPRGPAGRGRGGPLGARRHLSAGAPEGTDGGLLLVVGGSGAAAGVVGGRSAPELELAHGVAATESARGTAHYETIASPLSGRAVSRYGLRGHGWVLRGVRVYAARLRGDDALIVCCWHLVAFMRQYLPIGKPSVSLGSFRFG